MAYCFTCILSNAINRDVQNARDSTTSPYRCTRKARGGKYIFVVLNSGITYCRALAVCLWKWSEEWVLMKLKSHQSYNSRFIAKKMHKQRVTALTAIGLSSVLFYPTLLASRLYNALKVFKVSETENLLNFRYCFLSGGTGSCFYSQKHNFSL